MTNLGDIGNGRLKIELLERQILSSKFTFPRGFSAHRLDYLGNCGVCMEMGAGLHRCTATNNSSFVVISEFRYVGQHFCGFVYLLSFICSWLSFSLELLSLVSA